MKYLIAELISSLFHPVVFFLIMPFLIVYRKTESTMYALKWEIFSAAFVFIAVAIVLVGRKKKIFSDCDISKKDERYEFYAFLLFFGILYVAIALFFKGIFFPMSFISLGIIVGIVILDIANRYVKASNHIAVSAAFAATIGLLYGVEFFLVALWIVPLNAWARLYLKKHTKNEVFTGGMLGVIITLLTFFAGQYIYR